MFVGHERRAEIVVEDRFVAAPELVIEIISPGEDNARRDHETKRHIYGRFGVNEYWIVDPEQQAIEVYQLEDNMLELRKISTGDDELRSIALPDFVCQVSAIFGANV